MLTVNLSRLHNMIKENTADITRMTNSIIQNPLSFTLQIFELTTQQEYGHFTQQLAGRKELIENRIKSLRENIDYGEYLKNLLTEANAKCGVNQKIIHQAYLCRLMDSLKMILQVMNNTHDSSLTTVDNVDIFKSSFTDRVKIFAMTGYVFNANDVQAMRKQIDRLETERRGIYDEIADINQSHTLDVMTFKEFRKSAATGDA